MPSVMPIILKTKLQNNFQATVCFFTVIHVVSLMDKELDIRSLPASAVTHRLQTTLEFSPPLQMSSPVMPLFSHKGMRTVFNPDWSQSQLNLSKGVALCLYLVCMARFGQLRRGYRDGFCEEVLEASPVSDRSSARWLQGGNQHGSRPSTSEMAATPLG